MFVYVGAFTGQTGAEGISVYRMDTDSGALFHLQTVPGLLSPSFLARHPRRPFLYAVERQWSPERADVGAVAAFAIDAASGKLSLLNRQPSGGLSPCYVSVHPGGRHVLAAHYAGGQVTVLPIGEDGQLGEITDVVQHLGSGPDPNRQAGPHAHFIAADPSGRYVLACDLGLDRFMVYQLDTATGKLAPNALPFVQVSSGAGPRHLAFHPSRNFVYVINELDSTLSVFAFDAARGACRIVQTVSTLPDGFTGASHTAQVVVHPSGKFLYGSNRGHDSIAAFAIDAAAGKLRLIGHEPSRGKTPRNINLDPTGGLLLAANQDSDSIVGFRVDQDSGRLTATGQVTASPSPVCLVFGEAAG